MKKMTMADIAKVAGVSKTTVSRYFNGGYVKEETRQKIEKIVKENKEDMKLAGEKLVQQANEAGGKDNISVILVRL